MLLVVATSLIHTLSTRKYASSSLGVKMGSLSTSTGPRQVSMGVFHHRVPVIPPIDLLVLMFNCNNHPGSSRTTFLENVATPARRWMWAV